MDSHTLALLIAIILSTMAITGIFVLIVKMVLHWMKKG